MKAYRCISEEHSSQIIWKLAFPAATAIDEDAASTKEEVVDAGSLHLPDATEMETAVVSSAG